ncbi:acyl-CoA carboxylase subunit beta [Undibacterium arcticum]|uniref:Acyl-CoA carboxylase subunit beta n=1 Tax=Undibacterium arcticum TaxID=1762892 RepID=A0ABV7EUL8_9BURK
MKANHNQLAQRREQALLGGGAERIAAHHARGKLTARERVELLLDQGSCIEFDMFVEHRCADFGMAANKMPGDGVITCQGTINGRPVFLFAKDISAFHGTLSESHARKIAKIQDLALKNRAPLIGLFDSDGARVQEGTAALAGYGEQYRRSVAASGVIPQISVILGPCPGADAFSPPMTDFVFMVNDTSSMFVTGPDVVQTITNETVTVEELGGASVHTTQSSVADSNYDNDVTAILQMRRLVDFLPANNLDGVPEWSSFDDWERIEPSLDTLIPEDPDQPYDIKELILKVVDEGDFFEIQAMFASNIVTGFGRIAGRTIGIVANQPMVLAGVLDSDAARKAARFVRFCDAFGIPVVTLVDVPGFLPGTSQEHGGLIKHGAKLLFAFSQATVPLVTVVTRKAFGAAYTIMGSKHIGADVNYVWPTAHIGLMSAKSALAIIDGCTENDPDQVAERVKKYEECFNSSFAAAKQGYVDDIIMPCQTRRHIAQALAALVRKTSEQPWRKHDNIPL